MVRLRWVAIALGVSITACGEASTVAPLPVSPEGTWRAAESGVSESTLRLSEDGSFTRVVADLSGRACESSAGSWRTEGDVLRMQVNAVNGAPASSVESYSFTLAAGRLQLEGTGFSGDFAAVSSMVSCVDYGFGNWVGLLRAEVDGVQIDFDLVTIGVDVDGASLLIEGQYSDSAGERFVKLQIDGSPGPLEPGSFTVQNVPGASDTFYGLYHPDPTSVTFSGFDTTRLSPPGAFTLTSIAPERVVGSFQFRANPRVEGEIGPSGATFADITSGRVDLTYR